jgi:hypothetical protein
MVVDNMKNEEDEAFDDLAKRQGMWGGGFPAKRAMAADKLQEPESEALKLALEALESLYISPFTMPDNPIGTAITAIKAALAQPAQEPVGMLHIERLDKWLDASLKERKQREWVGLTDEETSGFTQHEMTVAKYVSKVLQEKNT